MAESKYPKYVWMDGENIPFEDAKIHVFSPAARYGINVFEGLRAYWSKEKCELYCFRLKEHYDRLFDSLKIMRMGIGFSNEDCMQYLNSVLRKNEIKEDVHIRHTVHVCGYGGFSAKEPIGMFILPIRRGRSVKARDGIRCKISSWVRISDNSVPPRIKAGANYQNSRLAAMEAQEDGYDQPIILNANGKVSESSASCFLMIRNGTLVTPPVTANILESVTRSTLLHICKDDLKIPVVEREIDRTEVYVADEAMLCGSGAEILPIMSVDRISIGNGDIGELTRKIMQEYFSIVRGDKEKYSHWLTPTYG